MLLPQQQHDAAGGCTLLPRQDATAGMMPLQTAA